MGRTIDIEAHRQKREAILDVLESLIVSKGYEQLTIADIMSGAAISKGAFYHYFQSKADVLSALLDRRIELWRELLTPVVEADRPALARLNEFLAVIAQRKTAERALLLEVAATVYADENAGVHMRARTAAADLFLPFVQQLLGEARGEGTVRIDDPAATAGVVVALIQDLSDRTGHALVAMADGADESGWLGRLTTAYVGALHRVLGVEPGVLSFLDQGALQAWADAALDRQQAAEHWNTGGSR